MLGIGYNPICVVLSCVTLGSNFVSLLLKQSKMKRKSEVCLLMLGHTQCINVVTNVKIANSYDTTNTIQLFCHAFEYLKLTQEKKSQQGLI